MLLNVRRIACFTLIFAVWADIVIAVEPITGPTVARFDSDPSGGIPKGQMGVFYDPKDPVTENFIENVAMQLSLPGSETPTGFLVLKYVVRNGKQNGFWIKLGGADWSSFKDGELLFLLRRLDPRVDKYNRTVELDSADTEAATRFRIELKGEAGDGSIRAVGRPQKVIAQQKLQQKKNGYFELRVPLKDFAMDLSSMSELVMVFEANRLAASERQGAIGIKEIVLLKERGKPLNPNSKVAAAATTKADEILDDLGRRAFLWTKKARHPRTGMVLDRTKNDEDIEISPQQPAMASIASVGYQLSLLPEFERLGYLTRKEAIRQATQTLRFIGSHLEGHESLYYHFVDWRNGKRWGDCEASVLDSSILLNGVMVVSSAYGGEITKMGDEILARANWRAYLTLHPQSGKRLLSLGWHPDRGLLGPADVTSSEMALAYFLAVGSRNNIPPECWYSTTVNYGELFGIKVLNPQHSLFTSYYGMGWHDLRGKKDRRGIDLFANARNAAEINIRFCREEGKREPTYSAKEALWGGISAGDSPTGYRAPACVANDPDGVVWPTTLLAALPWCEAHIQQTLPRWRNSRAWKDFAAGPYGLGPFRLGDESWRGADVIGIDILSYAVSLSNVRNRTVWRLWMKHPVAKSAYKRLGIR